MRVVVRPLPTSSPPPWCHPCDGRARRRMADPTARTSGYPTGGQGGRVSRLRYKHAGIRPHPAHRASIILSRFSILHNSSTLRTEWNCGWPACYCGCAPWYGVRYFGRASAMQGSAIRAERIAELCDTSHRRAQFGHPVVCPPKQAVGWTGRLMMRAVAHLTITTAVAHGCMAQWYS